MTLKNRCYATIHTSVSSHSARLKLKGQVTRAVERKFHDCTIPDILGTVGTCVIKIGNNNLEFASQTAKTIGYISLGYNRAELDTIHHQIPSEVK